jgi:drug/metabolite transporter (DMT)-like permease
MLDRRAPAEANRRPAFTEAPALSPADKTDAAAAPHGAVPQAHTHERAAFWLGTALMVFSACCFGFITTLSRLAYDSGGTPVTQVFLRFVAFVVLIGPLIAMLRRPLLLPRRGLVGAMGIAVLMLMMSAGYLFAVAYIPVSLGAMIFYTFPLMVGVLSAATGRERMTTVKAVALAGAFAGLALALGPSFAGLDPRGVALALTAAVGVTLTTLYGVRAMAGHDGLTFNFWTNAWMLVVASAYVLAAGGLAWPDSAAGGLAAVLATLAYVVAFITWFAGLKLIQPTYGAMMLNVEPVVSILAATLLLGERLGALQVAGVVLVLGMLTLMAASGRRGRRH